MNKLAFDLVSDKKTEKFDFAVSEKFYAIGLGGGLIFMGLSWLLNKYYGIKLYEIDYIEYLPYLFIFFFLIGIFYGLFDYDGNNRIIKGFITFDENEITINHAERYSLSELQSLKFNVKDYKGKLINVHTNGDPNNSYGGNNYVEFTHANKNYKYQFVANSERQKDRLINELIPIMRNKTEIKY